MSPTVYLREKHGHSQASSAPKPKSKPTHGQGQRTASVPHGHSSLQAAPGDRTSEAVGSLHKTGTLRTIAVALLVEIWRRLFRTPETEALPSFKLFGALWGSGFSTSQGRDARSLGAVIARLDAMQMTLVLCAGAV